MNYLPLICSGILGLTLGIGLNHKMGSPSETVQSVTPPINIYTHSNSPSSQRPLSLEPSAAPSPNDFIPSPGATRDVNALLKKQDTLRRQLAEQSKELQTLNFRLDMLSDNFKPLRKEANDTGVPNSGPTPLLPPIQ